MVSLLLITLLGTQFYYKYLCFFCYFQGGSGSNRTSGYCADSCSYRSQSEPVSRYSRSGLLHCFTVHHIGQPFEGRPSESSSIMSTSGDTKHVHVSCLVILAGISFL